MESDHEHAKGYVYILTNPSFREDWVKIGKSSRPVNVRSKELDNTAVPLPFEIFATLETVKFHEAETLVHEMIDDLTDLRIRQNREFFNIKPAAALKIFHRIARIIDDAVITVGTPPEEFNFCDIGIKEGETVTFTPTNVDVKVVSEKKVEHEGQKYTLTEFACKFIPKNKRDASNSYWELAYFEYKGRKLIDIWKNKNKNKNFNFCDVGIKEGETVTFTPTNVDVRVFSDTTVVYEGQEYTLTGFTREFMPENMRNPSNSYRGPAYFTYKGQKLVDIWKDYLGTQKTANPNTGTPEEGDTEPDPTGTGEGGRKPPFKFSMVGIKIGETATFTPTNVDVKVFSDTTVAYEGQEYTLTEFACKFISENKRDASNSYWELAYFEYKGRKLLDIWKNKNKNKNFNFRDVGIKKDETVTFTPTNVDVKVFSDTTVVYEGQEYTLTGFTREFMPENMRNPSNSYRGPAYFTYKGQKLVDIWEDYLGTQKTANPNTGIPGRGRYWV